MIDKETSIVEITGWLAAQAAVIGLKSVKRLQTVDPDRDKFPAVFIHEGDDVVVKHSSNSRSGYPVLRTADVVFEVWCDRNKNNIRTLHSGIRGAVFGGTFTSQVEIREKRTFGPINGSVPNVLVMQLVISLTYKDRGPTS